MATRTLPNGVEVTTLGPTKLYRYTVSGVGVFPVDMLRYDSAWPDDQEAASKIVRDPYANTDVLGKYTVHLAGINPPTDARWRSFGWTVSGRY